MLFHVLSEGGTHSGQCPYCEVVCALLLNDSLILRLVLFSQIFLIADCPGNRKGDLEAPHFIARKVT